MKIRLEKFSWFEKRDMKKKWKRDPKEYPMACIHYCFNLFGRRWVVQDDWIINTEFDWEFVPFSWYSVMLAHEWMHDFLYHEISGEACMKLDNISIGLDLHDEDLIDDAWEELGK